MIRSVLKPVLIGIFAGTALFFFGFFLLRILLFFFLIGLIIRFFVWRSWRWGYRGRYRVFSRPHPGDAYHFCDGTVIYLRRNESDNNNISID